MAIILTTTGLSLYQNTSKKYLSPTEDQMRETLRENPVSASAESNSLIQIAQPDDSIILLHTASQRAKLCADLLQKFFIEDRGFKPFQIRIQELDFKDDEDHIETHGLRNLVNTLVNEIDKAQNSSQEVIINATAGYKLEIVYSTMIGMLNQVPIKYMHERFERIVTLNPIALDWDISLFLQEKHSEFFEWLDKSQPQNDVEERLQNLFDRAKIEMLLTPDGDNKIGLSPLGQVLWLKFMYESETAEKIAWPPEVQVKNIDEKIANSIIKHGHDYPKWTKKNCRQIAHIPYVQIIIPEHFSTITRSTVSRVYENGSIEVYWTEGGKAAKLKIQTTAQGRPQTLKVAREIRKIVEKN